MAGVYGSVFNQCIILLMLVIQTMTSSQVYKPAHYSAYISYSYKDLTSTQETSGVILGRYGVVSPNYPVTNGMLVHYVTDTMENHACGPLHVNYTYSENTRWIALIQRGSCKFEEKIQNALNHNASAVIVYNNNHEGTLLTMQHIEDGLVAVFISKADGELLTSLTDSGIQVKIHITRELAKNTQTVSDVPIITLSFDYKQAVIIMALGWCLFAVSLAVMIGYGIRKAVTSRRNPTNHVAFSVNDSDLLITNAERPDRTCATGPCGETTASA